MSSRSKSRAREQDYRRKLKALAKIGAYSPTGQDLTHARKSRINALWEEYGSRLDNPRNPSFFIAAPTSSAKARRRFLEDAQSLDIKTTRKGILYAKGGHTKARTVLDVESGEYRIELSGRVKRGDRKGKKYQDLISIAPVDAIGQERERIERMAKQFEPLAKGEQIGFVLIENNRELGASRATFHSARRLVEYIDTNYHRDNKAAKLAFLRLVMVRKTTLFKWEKGKKRTAGKRTKVVTWKVINTMSDEVVLWGLDKTTAVRKAKTLTRQTDELHVAAPEWR